MKIFQIFIPLIVASQFLVACQSAKNYVIPTSEKVKITQTMTTIPEQLPSSTSSVVVPSPVKTSPLINMTSTPVVLLTPLPSSMIPILDAHSAEVGALIQSKNKRVNSTGVPETDIKEYMTNSNYFAYDLLFPLIQPNGKNFIYSPYSLTMVMGMTYAGARGDTALQMADAMRFTLPPDRLYAAINSVDQELMGLPHGSDNESYNVHLNIANSLWGQVNRTYLPEYLDILSKYYGTGINLEDFTNKPEESRMAINDWVSKKTEEKITNLIPSGGINSLTKLVLVNAVYFNDAWQHPFAKEDTKDEYFYMVPNGQVQTPMMHTSAKFGYISNKIYQAISLPYKNCDLSMIIIMPVVEQFDEFEKTLNAKNIEDIIPLLQEQPIDLTFPKFKFETNFSLVEPLVKLGILNAFAPLSANFSGIDGTREIFIGNIIQKAYISVDEYGTEAAAATAATMKTTALETDSPIIVKIDHPFIFAIRDQQTGTVLFIGRLLNPVLGKEK